MPVTDVACPDAKALMDKEGYLYLDVRTVMEFEAGHPEGAFNIPVVEPSPAGQMQQNPNFLSSVQAKFPKDTKLVIGCMAGGRSRLACEILQASGYTNVKNVAGGFGGGGGSKGWRDSGLPVSKQPHPGKKYQELKK